MTVPRTAARAGPLALALAAAATVGLWWALVPHLLSALALGLAALGWPRRPDRLRPRVRVITALVAVAVLVLVLANDVATFGTGPFLPRWE